MKEIEFKRNKQFDYPFFDSLENDRFTTTAGEAAKRIVESNRPLKAQSRLCPLFSEIKRCNIAPLFSYPQLQRVQSVSASSHQFDDRHKKAIAKLEKEHVLRRNTHSEYNEKRAKYGFKFK
jgi:hypothetical protein